MGGKRSKKWSKNRLSIKHYDYAIMKESNQQNFYKIIFERQQLERIAGKEKQVSRLSKGIINMGKKDINTPAGKLAKGK